MYALIKKVITNYNMWSIFNTNVSLRLQSYFRLFLLHAWAFKGNESNEHLNPLYWWLHTRVYCLLRQGIRFIMYVLDISRAFFSLKWHLKLTTKQPTLVGNLGIFGGGEV